LGDSNFANIAAGTIQALYGGTTGINAITVGSNALRAGITAIYGGTGSDNISALAYGTNAVTLSGGGGTDNLIAASSGATTFLFQNQLNFNGSGVTGGTTLLDTIAFSDPTVLLDGGFTNASRVENLQFLGTGTSSVTFGANGSAAGITSVTGVGSGAVTFTLLSNTNSVTFTGGAGTDSFVIDYNNAYTSSAIIGGAGSDTLSFGTTYTAITDSMFTNVSQLEVVSTGTSVNTFTVGSTALGAGVVSLATGSAAATFNVGSGFGTTGISLAVASGGTGTFSFVDGTSFSSSTLTGGTGASDLVIFENAVTVNSTRSLAILTYVESIYLNGTASSSFTFANGGVDGQIGGTNTTTIYGTNAANTISFANRTSGNVSVNGSSSFADTFTGGIANDTLQGWGVPNSLLIDSLTGGSGADRFVIASGYTAANDLSGDVGYAGGAGFAIITDYGLGNDVIAIGAGTTTFTSISNTSSWYAQTPSAGSGYQFEIMQNTSVIAKGNFGTGYTGGIAGISFIG